MGQFPLSFILLLRNTGTYKKYPVQDNPNVCFLYFCVRKKISETWEKNASTENYRFGIFCKLRKNITELSQKSVQKFPQYPPAL